MVSCELVSQNCRGYTVGRLLLTVALPLDDDVASALCTVACFLAGAARTGSASSESEPLTESSEKGSCLYLAMMDLCSVLELVSSEVAAEAVLMPEDCELGDWGFGGVTPAVTELHRRSNQNWPLTIECLHLTCNCSSDKMRPKNTSMIMSQLGDTILGQQKKQNNSSCPGSNRGCQNIDG